MKDSQTLPDDKHTLHHMILELQSQVQLLQQERQHLLEQFRLAQQKRFGVSSESHPGQGELFNEAEEETDHDDEESDTQTISHTCKTPKRQSLPKSLPRETVVHDISDEDKVCDYCGGELHQMGEAKSWNSSLLRLKSLSISGQSTVAVPVSNKALRLR